MKENKLDLIAKKQFHYSDELYKLIDFLNKILKSKRIVLGISKEKDNAIISVYEI